MEPSNTPKTYFEHLQHEIAVGKPHASSAEVHLLAADKHRRVQMMLDRKVAEADSEVEE